MSDTKSTPIRIGSALPYLMEYTGILPSIEDICNEDNLLGYIKGGATITYTENTNTETDDLGYQSKTITTKEEVKIKLGLITWDTNKLNTLIDRSTVSTSNGKRILKIGGAGNAKNKQYVLCLHHVDKVDGDLHALIIGRNTAGLSLALQSENGSKVEPEFTAAPQDKDGTLLQIIEQIIGGETEVSDESSGSTAQEGN
ncbi:MAG: hypothetical protein ACI4II_06325 [Acutalibacteraceae bacterium]